MAKKHSSSQTDKPPEPNPKQALALVKKMMAIPGPSGHEGDVISFITRELRKAGVPTSAINSDHVHKRSPIGGQAGNLTVKLPGSFRAPRRLLMAHVDTVPICVDSRPVQHGDRIHSANPNSGLGADNRSGAATILNTALQIVREKLPHPPLTFLFPVQEEVGMVGARYVSLSQLGRPKFAFNFDGGSATKLTIGATGAYSLTIHVNGRASHAGVAPEKGVSAIAIAGLAISRLQQDGWLGLIRKRGKSGTSNIGHINGGGATNVVTDQATLRAEVRSHDRRFRKTILQAFIHAFEQAARTVRNTSGQRGSVRIEQRLDYEAFKLRKSEPSVRIAQSAVQSIGGEPTLFVCNGGLDANWLTNRGIPTVTLGAGQQNPHMLNENLDIDAFKNACRIGLRLATAAIG